jgi:SnoaL-like domain
MNSVTPAAPDTEAAQAWVAALAEGWLAPTSADAFADHFQPWLDPQVRLIQPQLPTLVGHRAFRERFARPLFALIPDLHGQVERSAVGADCAYVELTLRGTLGGRPVAWRARRPGQPARWGGGGAGELLRSAAAAARGPHPPPGMARARPHTDETAETATSPSHKQE